MCLMLAPLELPAVALGGGPASVARQPHVCLVGFLPSEMWVHMEVGILNLCACCFRQPYFQHPCPMTSHQSLRGQTLILGSQRDLALRKKAKSSRCSQSTVPFTRIAPHSRPIYQGRPIPKVLEYGTGKNSPVWVAPVPIISRHI